MSDLSLVVPKSSRESIQIAKLLSEKNSPLVNIIKGISDNTTLTIDKKITGCSFIAARAPSLDTPLQKCYTQIIMKNYPFTAILGQDEMKAALILNLINPKLGGVLMGSSQTAAWTCLCSCLKYPQ